MVKQFSTHYGSQVSCRICANPTGHFGHGWMAGAPTPWTPAGQLLIWQAVLVTTQRNGQVLIA